MNYDSKEGEDRMRKIYTGIDLGSDSIKIVVANKMNKKFHVLAASSYPSSGVRKGQVINIQDAVCNLKKCILEVEAMLGLSLRKTVLCVPEENVTITIVTGKVAVLDPLAGVSFEDVQGVLAEALRGKIDEEDELVTTVPIHFVVGSEITKDPKGMKGDTLEVKAVIATVPKEPLYRMLEVVRLAGLEAIDVCFHTVGDYFEVKNNRIDSEVGAIVNIGKEVSRISIFNKGIMIKNSSLPIGSYFVDKDISYVYKVSFDDARKLKEEFATAVMRYADSNDLYELDCDDEKKEIEQVELSKIVEARIYEILKLVKKELKILTNREISYIIITGGLSELAGFQYAVEDILGRNARVCNMTTMGVRHNKYSSVLGILKYYDDKLDLRGKHESMFTERDIDLLLREKKQEVSNEHIINKVFGHFFED